LALSIIIGRKNKVNPMPGRLDYSAFKLLF
jgi:hypothetical protein